MVEEFDQLEPETLIAERLKEGGSAAGGKVYLGYSSCIIALGRLEPRIKEQPLTGVPSAYLREELEMERLIAISALFVLAGLCEIGGGYLVWGWMRESKPLFWALFGAAILAAYGIVAALQPISEFGRVYAAYGGIFIALSLAWGVVVDGFRPDRYDLLGALICVTGVVIMVAPSRS
jgi:small multidrug resistance family-3 protein